jgi:hypothetical protein
MEKSLKVVVCFVIVFVLTGLASGQDWAQTWVPHTQRVDLRSLGFPDVNEIPENSSAITSLATASDGNIYGATTGEAAYLFVFQPSTNKVRHLGRIPGEESVHHSLAEGEDGSIYLGTGLNMFDQIDISEGGYWEDVAENLWKDIQNHFAAYPGGHLYRYRPSQSNSNVKLPDMEAELEDLGVPLAHNSIYALCASPEGDVLYGITYPDGHFFLYKVGEGSLQDLGPIDDTVVFHGPERWWRSLPRSLICDDTGRVFTSSKGGELVYYSPAFGKIVSTGLKIPGNYYPAQFYTDYAVVEYFARHSDGSLYGGTSDGYLIRLDPEKMSLTNLGKPRAERRLRCLAVGNDGCVYLVAGERPQTSPVPCKFYRFDPATGGFDDYGLLIADRSPFYYRRGYQFDSMTTGTDGTIFLGESERGSSLFLFLPPSP